MEYVEVWLKDSSYTVSLSNLDLPFSGPKTRIDSDKSQSISVESLHKEVLILLLKFIFTTDSMEGLNFLDNKVREYRY